MAGTITREKLHRAIIEVPAADQLKVRAWALKNNYVIKKEGPKPRPAMASDPVTDATLVPGSVHTVYDLGTIQFVLEDVRSSAREVFE